MACSPSCRTGRVCRDGTYLLDGACVETCPTGMAMLGIGDFKRRCMAPFECQRGRIIGMDVGYGCKCANDDMTPAACHFCSFRANEFGQHCTRCNGGKYLQADNRCHDNCDGTGLIAYAPGNCALAAPGREPARSLSPAPPLLSPSPSPSPSCAAGTHS